jgi:hypothetical protein
MVDAASDVDGDDDSDGDTQAYSKDDLPFILLVFCKKERNPKTSVEHVLAKMYS